MNIFYYSIQETRQASEVYAWLKSLHPPLHIQQLPSGKGLSTKESLELRNGDVLVIFVRNQDELQELIKQKIDSNDYKICLLFEKQDQELIKEGLLLSPRHYSSIEKNYVNVEETLRKILKAKEYQN